MKKLLLSFAVLITSQAYTQPYIPLNLDTSCYWVLKYGQYDAGWVATGEHTAYVTGEVTQNGKTYFSVHAYPSSAPQLWFSIYLNHYMSGQSNLLREDTAQRKVYYYSTFDSTEKVYLDFGLQPGDTMITYGNKSYLIDSVAYKYILGVNRRCQFGHSVDNHNDPMFITIEGIGANENFPVAGWTLEWSLPLYNLKCYSKNGIQLYGDSTAACPKNPIYTSVAEAASQQAEYVYTNNTLQIKNPLHHPMQLSVYNMDGRRCINHSFQSESFTISLNDLQPGIYIIRLRDGARYSAGKILVE